MRQSVSLSVLELLPLTYVWPWMTSPDLHRWRHHLRRYITGQHRCPRHHRCPCMSYLVIRSENMAVSIPKLNWHLKNEWSFLAKKMSGRFPRQSTQKIHIQNRMPCPQKHFREGHHWCTMVQLFCQTFVAKITAYEKCMSLTCHQMKAKWLNVDLITLIKSTSRALPPKSCKTRIRHFCLELWDFTFGLAKWLTGSVEWKSLFNSLCRIHRWSNFAEISSFS